MLSERIVAKSHEHPAGRTVKGPQVTLRTQTLTFVIADFTLLVVG